jgi:glutamate-1-semialdehyde aminotransferase
MPSWLLARRVLFPCVLPRPEFLAALREQARAHGVVLIFDEVITGFRHDLGGYQRLAGVTPDLSTFAKACECGIFMLLVALKRNHVSAAHTIEDIDRTLEVARDVLRALPAGGER